MIYDDETLEEKLAAAEAVEPEAVEDLEEDEFTLEECRLSPLYSPVLALDYGVLAAVSFVLGSELLYDMIREDRKELEKLPAGSCLKDMDESWLEGLLPEQFADRYDQAFLESFEKTVAGLLERAKDGADMEAYTVMEELAFYLIQEGAREWMEPIAVKYIREIEISGTAEGDDENSSHQDALEMAKSWEDWVFELFGDDDIVLLYAPDHRLPEEDEYHFDHWQEVQFWQEVQE